MPFQRTQKDKTYTPDEALKRLEHWCAYQERSPGELREQIQALGQSGEVADQLYQVLETDGYVNEKRFAETFAGGKLRIKHWGKIRIRRELRQRAISNEVIEKVLATIEEAEYSAVLDKIIAQYARKFEEVDFAAKGKIATHAIRKGFEPERVFSALERVLEA